MGRGWGGHFERECPCSTKKNLHRKRDQKYCLNAVKSILKEEFGQKYSGTEEIESILEEKGQYIGQ